MIKLKEYYPTTEGGAIRLSNNNNLCIGFKYDYLSEKTVRVYIGFRNFHASSGKTYYYAGSAASNSIKLNGKSIIKGAWNRTVGNWWIDVGYVDVTCTSGGTYGNDSVTLPYLVSIYHGASSGTLQIPSGAVPQTKYYSSCLPPTSITFSSTVLKPGDTLYITVSGGRGGTNNGIGNCYIIFNGQTYAAASITGASSSNPSAQLKIVIPESWRGKTIKGTAAFWQGKAGSVYRSKVYNSSQGIYITKALPDFSVKINGQEAISVLLPSERTTKAVITMTTTKTESAQKLYYKLSTSSSWTEYTSSIAVDPECGPENAIYYNFCIGNPKVNDYSSSKTVKIARDYSFHLTGTDSMRHSLENSAALKKFFEDNPTWLSSQYSIIIDGSPSDINSATIDASGMFKGLTNLVRVDISEWNMSNVSSTEEMFSGCTKLSTDMEIPDLPKVSSVRNMFKDCSSLEKIVFHDFGKITDISTLLSGCSGLKTAVFDFSSLSNASYIKNVKTLLTDCSKLESFECEYGFPSVKDFSNMFNGKSKLTTVVLNNISKAKNLSGLFKGCINLVNITTESSESKSAATMIDSMYENCTKLESISLLPNLTSVVSVSGLFAGCENLQTIDWNGMNFLNIYNFQRMFQNCHSLQNLDLTAFNTQNAVYMNRMFEGMSLIEEIDLSSFFIPQVTTFEGMFRDDTNLKTVIFNENDKPTKITNMAGMFENCYKIQDINLTVLYTQNVTDMSAMFKNCYSLETLDMSSFETEKVTTFKDMFSGCRCIRDLDIRNFSIESLSNASNMFLNCVTLKYIQVLKGSDWTSKGISGEAMFKNCYLLPDFNASSVSIDKAKTYSDLGGYFFGISNVVISTTKLNLDESIGTEDDPIILSEENIPFNLILVPKTDYYSIYIDSQVNPVNTSEWIPYRTVISTNQQTIEKDSNISAIFNSSAGELQIIKYAPESETYSVIGKIEDILPYVPTLNDKIYLNIYLISGSDNDLVTFDKYNEVSSTFSNDCEIYTAKVEGTSYQDSDSLEGAFKGCENLSVIDFSSADLMKVLNFKSLCEGCSNLEEIIFPENLHSYISCSKMFSKCKAITTITFPKIDMYLNSDISEMFNECESLEEVDLSTFTFGYNGGINFTKTFYNCYNLKTIYGTNWIANYSDKQTITDDNMFYNCNSLSGSIAYSSDKIDSTYANPTTGYFTAPAALPIKVNQKNLYHLRVWTRQKGVSSNRNDGLFTHVNLWKTPSGKATIEKPSDWKDQLVPAFSVEETLTVSKSDWTKIDYS